MELLQDIVTAFVPLLAAICGWAAGRLREIKKKDEAAGKERKAIREGLKGLLRAKVIDLGLHYIEAESIPPYGLETLRSCYDPYMTLGDGDPSVTSIMQKCEALPVKSGSAQ